MLPDIRFCTGVTSQESPVGEKSVQPVGDLGRSSSLDSGSTQRGLTQELEEMSNQLQAKRLQQGTALDTSL